MGCCERQWYSRAQRRSSFREMTVRWHSGAASFRRRALVFPLASVTITQLIVGLLHRVAAVSLVLLTRWPTYRLLKLLRCKIADSACSWKSFHHGGCTHTHTHDFAVLSSTPTHTRIFATVLNCSTHLTSWRSSPAFATAARLAFSSKASVHSLCYSTSPGFSSMASVHASAFTRHSIMAATHALSLSPSY
jgi:hypothetical protein